MWPCKQTTSSTCVDGVQVEVAALQYRSSRLVRGLDAKTGERKGFGEDGRTEVVSAR